MNSCLRLVPIISVLAMAAGASHGASLPLSIAPTPTGPLIFTLSQVSGGVARFTVKNASTTPQSLTATVSGLFPLNASAASAPQLEITGPAVIAAGAGQTFQLLPFKTVPAPGTYSALFRLLVNDNDALVPQQITITVAAPELLRAKDAVTLFRWMPFCSSWWPGLWAKSLSIPVRGGSDFPGKPQQVTGVIGRDTGGGWTLVRWDGSGNRLSVDSPPVPGTYTGDLILTTDPTKITYSLTVIAKDAVVFPALIIGVGIILAYHVKRYVGLLRVTWELRLQEAELGDRFRQSQIKFASTTHGQPFGAYSIAADVTVKRRASLDSIKAIEKTPGSTIDKTNPAFQAVLIELAALETGIDSWPNFGTDLDALSTALETVRSSINGGDMEPPQASPPDPHFLKSALALLHGDAIKLEQFTTIGTNVNSFRALAELWPTARQRAAHLTDLFRRLHTPSGAAAHPLEFVTAQNAIVALWVTLGSVQKVDGLSAMLAAGADFDIVEIQLNQLQAVMAPFLTLFALSPLTATMASSQSPVVNWFRSPADAHGPASDRRRTNLLQARILRSDLAVSWFAFGLALITGLNLYYIGKPFGSPADYATLFIWAAGTKATLDMILAVTDQLGVGLSPGKPKLTA